MPLESIIITSPIFSSEILGKFPGPIHLGRRDPSPVETGVVLSVDLAEVPQLVATVRVVIGLFTTKKKTKVCLSCFRTRQSNL